MLGHALISTENPQNELPVGYTHGLLLREGGVVASGLLDDVLTDENLSATFGLPLGVQRRRGRYTAWMK